MRTWTISIENFVDRIYFVGSNERFKFDGGYVKWAQWDSEYYTDFNLPRPVRL